MSSSLDDFSAIGLPRGATVGDTDYERVGLHLLETLDALTAVYESAEFFADIPGEAAITAYALGRCVAAANGLVGALLLDGDRGLELHCSHNDGAALLDIDAVRQQDSTHAVFYNGEKAAPWLVDRDAGWNVLMAPIRAGSRGLGLVVVLRQLLPFSTLDTNLVAAVCSQAAIALSSAIHYRDVELERARLRSLIDNHSQGIVVLDHEGATVLCNPEACQLCSYDAAAAGPGGFLAHLASRDPGMTMASLAGDSTERELEFDTGDDRHIVGIHANAIHGQDGAIATMILTLRDLTRIRREERLKRDFLSLISHKFRTPITALCCAIRLFTEVDEAERAELVEETTRRTDELTALVDRLLYFSELLDGSWSARGEGDLCRLRDELPDQLARRYPGRSFEIEWDLAADATALQVPAARLRAALDNLVDNAIKFGPPGCAWVRVSSRRTAGGEVQIEVEDRGPGIPAHEHEQIFRSFYQHDEDFTGSVEGAGIGLGIVQEIATRVGGSVCYRDARPHGAIFTLTLPASDPTGKQS
ncbi:MAG: PAS domain-containing sensor histidine kinase [Planctomycetes bacterium]|nr:PAS domain-containing sensor histidine kinase [Planctomycetota bacterium]